MHAYMWACALTLMCTHTCTTVTLHYFIYYNIWLYNCLALDQHQFNNDTGSFDLFIKLVYFVIVPRRRNPVFPYHIYWQQQMCWTHRKGNLLLYLSAYLSASSLIMLLLILDFLKILSLIKLIFYCNFTIFF